MYVYVLELGRQVCGDFNLIYNNQQGLWLWQVADVVRCRNTVRARSMCTTINHNGIDTIPNEQINYVLIIKQYMQYTLKLVNAPTTISSDGCK